MKSVLKKNWFALFDRPIPIVLYYFFSISDAKFENQWTIWSKFKVDKNLFKYTTIVALLLETVVYIFPLQTLFCKYILTVDPHIVQYWYSVGSILYSAVLVIGQNLLVSDLRRISDARFYYDQKASESDLRDPSEKNLRLEDSDH